MLRANILCTGSRERPGILIADNLRGDTHDNNWIALLLCHP